MGVAGPPDETTACVDNVPAPPGQEGGAGTADRSPLAIAVENVAPLLPGVAGVHTGVILGNESGGLELSIVGEFIELMTASGKLAFAEMARLVTSGICCPRAGARPVIILAIVGKRNPGSLAILRIITVINAGGRPGLIRVGEGGIVLSCCAMIVAGSVPRNGGVPVQTS